MTRTELYEHGLAVTNRIYELQVIHNWSEEEVRVAFGLVDEPLSIHLHNVGKSASYLQYSISQSVYSFPTRLHAPSWAKPSEEVC